jgi:hypothetical protein
MFTPSRPPPNPSFTKIVRGVTLVYMIHLMARLRILCAVAATLLILFALRAVFLNRIKPAPSVQAVLVLNPSQATRFSTTSTSGAPSNASVQGRKEEELNPSLWNPAEEQIHRRISEELRAAHPGIAAFLMSDALAPV